MDDGGISLHNQIKRFLTLTIELTYWHVPKYTIKLILKQPKWNEIKLWTSHVGVNLIIQTLKKPNWLNSPTLAVHEQVYFLKLKKI